MADEQTRDPGELARAAVEIASERQASDTVMLDIRALTTFADYFVITSALNARHMQALIEELDQGMKGAGASLHHREGSADSGWVLLDFEDVIVHLFLPAERERYGLEQLWQGAPAVVRVQ